MKAIADTSQSSWRYWVLVPLLFLGFVSIIATGGGGGGGGGNGGVTEKAVVNGTVAGSGGIGGVTVSAGGVSTTTDGNGYYELKDIPIPADDQLVLTYEKGGYATYQRVIPVANGETYTVAAHLMAYNYSEDKDAAQDQNIEILDPTPDPGNPLAEIDFPADSIAASGTYSINIGIGDPTTDDGAAVFPGDYMAASTAGGSADTPLESVAFTELTITDDQGNEVTQLSKPATLTVRLPDSLQTKYAAGDTIEWWSYDEATGTWKREDADPDTPETMDDATVIDLRGDGVLYAQAKAMHLTWWNVDEPVNQHSCLCTTIVNADGGPMVGEFLTAAGVSYTGVSRPARTNESGHACVTIKRSNSDMERERIKLYAEFGGIQFDYDVTNTEEGDVDSNELFTPLVAGSTVRTIPDGQCVELANSITVGLNGEINGTVTYEGSGSPVPNLTINTNYGESTTTNANGEYVLVAPIGTPVDLYIVGVVSQTVTVASITTPATVNLAIPNRPPVIQSITRNPEGAVNNNQSVNLTVTASDPDGDDLSYTWEVVNGLGTLNQTTGSSVTWTAPATDAGTALVRVTASDGYGGEVSSEVSIVYSPASVGGTNLSFLIKDNRVDDQPLAGAVVALYNTDNKTIERTLVSGSDGVVDFGDVGREQVTITIAYEYNPGGSSAFRYVDSFIEVPTAEGIVYYSQDDNLDFGSPGDIQQITLNPIVYPGAGITTIDPTYAWWSHAAGTGQLTNIPIHNYEIQNDGKFTLLALTHDSTNTVIKWGMLENQTFAENTVYNINLDHDPIVVGWSTTPSTELDTLDIIGVRKGVEYTLYSSPYDFVPSTTGSNPLATEFPVDNYWLWATSNISDVMSVNTGKSYPTLPQTLEIPIADYNFGSVSYNSDNGVLSWTQSGTSPSDVMNISLSGYSNLEQPVQWSIAMAPDSTSWKVMDLPSPANTWFDTTNLASSVNEANLEVVDFDFLNGVDETWAFFITGGDLLGTSSQVLQGEYDFTSLLFSVSPLKAQAPNKAQGQTAVTQSIGDRLSGNWSHLRRR